MDARHRDRGLILTSRKIMLAFALIANEALRGAELPAGIVSIVFAAPRRRRNPRKEDPRAPESVDTRDLRLSWIVAIRFSWRVLGFGCSRIIGALERAPSRAVPRTFLHLYTFGALNVPRLKTERVRMHFQIPMIVSSILYVDQRTETCKERSNVRLNFQGGCSRLLEGSPDERNERKKSRSWERSILVEQRTESRVNATKHTHTVLHGAEESDGNVKWNTLARTHRRNVGRGWWKKMTEEQRRCSVNRDRQGDVSPLAREISRISRLASP